jgi:hypothetical protein
MFTTAVSSFAKREGEDITGNATAIAEICGTPDEIDRIGLRVRLAQLLLPVRPPTVLTLSLLSQVGMLFIVRPFCPGPPCTSSFLMLTTLGRPDSSPQILVTSLMGTCFPILAKRIPVLRRNVPGAVFEFAKYFGSGVILTTAFMHLLEPAADEELNGDK